MNLNKVFLIGRLTADPQMRTTPGGTPVGTFSIATNRVWTNKAGERKEDVQFHNVVVWGRQAEVVNQFLKKGSIVMVEGRLQTRSWQDAQGQNRRTTEVICEKVQLGPRSFGAGPARSGESEAPIKDEVKEELPEINLDEGDIKPENIPF
ncbi:MAG: Single-stranded DNA-binding protein [Candidatus Jorgensenbacteria bacterium GW2011_GWA1_48_11]|uniref:Single-stranded DNA-binding protein n=1 Tax=Candidatus Jorgensenbacteria bacterium GW2011_GWA1_48_11 TaxID=1618660 RepID=A0A0G1UAR8_9BACT|nr:MAG: Single-stranded DNA-binding protein [Candidatus Jorgensenbacteria bacterium GW2011_GWA1_48_11]KKW11880.1 MAG: Single-stranded DNA-binding protein [Candidatus Jorgensenbacteria bacterium GW2011_GWB1_49_9]HCQ93413.1 single-stranded DNA-binding protein [Candidatus Beckwithbacteria bacterium]